MKGQNPSSFHTVITGGFRVYQGLNRYDIFMAELTINSVTKKVWVARVAQHGKRYVDDVINCNTDGAWVDDVETVPLSGEIFE